MSEELGGRADAMRHIARNGSMFERLAIAERQESPPSPPMGGPTDNSAARIKSSRKGELTATVVHSNGDT